MRNITLQHEFARFAVHDPFAVILLSSILNCVEETQVSAQTTFTLKATPKTVAWGHYDAKAALVLHVKSGDTLGKMDPHGIRALTIHSKNSGAGFLADML
jgi:hypothetical protein